MSGLGKPIGSQGPSRSSQTGYRFRVHDRSAQPTFAPMFKYHSCRSLSVRLSTVEVILLYARLLGTHAGTSTDLPTVSRLCDQLENWKSTAKCCSVSLIQLSGGPLSGLGAGPW
jgi:hypothetical protein